MITPNNYILGPKYLEDDWLLYMWCYKLDKSSEVILKRPIDSEEFGLVAELDKDKPLGSNSCQHILGYHTAPTASHFLTKTEFVGLYDYIRNKTDFGILAALTHLIKSRDDCALLRTFSLNDLVSRRKKYGFRFKDF